MRDEVLSVRLSDFSRSFLPLVESEMRTLLSGPGHDHFAFNNWASDLWFDNLRITPL